MCIAGSRRGSGESCYQELSSEGQGQQQQQQLSQATEGRICRVRSTGSLRVQSGDKESEERQTAEISVDPSVQNAIFIRISEEETAAASSTTAQSLLPPTGHRGSTTTTSTFRRLSDADRLLIEALETGRERTRHTGRFLTMHKRRRKRLTTRSLAQDPGILDDIFHGQVQCVLQKSGSWRFNAFTLETVTGGRSLPVLCVHLFHWYGLLEHFKLDVVRVWKLFNLIEEGYHSTNPYHNSIHATDVTQAMHCFLQEEKIRSNLSPLEIMASLIGAVTHDLDHPGVNQPFLVATRNHLAALYENTSVLENHHWRSAIGCLLESGVSEQLAAEVRPELERHISSLILATDITRQQEFLTRFKRYLDQNLLDMTRSEDRHFILQIALKCADISNPCRPWDISRKWSHKVCEEFFRQGDYERRLNLPVTPLCDRNTTSIPRIQAGFFKLVVTPLYEEWHRFLRTGLSVDLMDYLKGNQSRWEALIQQDAAEETKTEISELEEIDNAVSSEDEGPAEDSGSIELLLPDSSLSRRTSLPVEAEVERVGRRHSVPLSVPKLLPIARTIIRRESLPTEQKKLTKVPHVKLEDQHLLGRDSLSLLSSRSSLHDSTTMNYSTERPVSAENLLPEPSIASITNSAEASRLSTVLQPDQKLPCQTKQLTRQQTFPPLQPYVRMRHMSTTIEMSQCSEALIEADSPSSSTPSPVTETSGSVDPDRAVATESPSRDSSEDSNGRSSSGPSSVVGGTVTKDSDASDGAAMIGRRRGSALPGSIRRPEAASSSEIARRHSMQVPGSLHVVSNLTFPSLPQTSAKDSVSTREDEISSFDIQSRRESVEPDLESPRSTDSKYQQANSKADSTSTTVGDLNTESTISSRVRCHHGSNVSPKHSAFFDETEASDSISDVANEGSCCSQMEYCESASRRFSTPTIDASAKADSAIRRFSAIPVSNESHQHKVFFVGTPPDSPPHVPSGSSDSGSEPRRSISNSTSESVSVGTKRDPDTSRDRGSKIPKLSVEPTMKENVDPRTSDEGKVLPAVKRNSQGWARRRSSAPVGLLSKVDDILALAAVTPRGDQYSRRGSVPTDMTRHQNGGSNRSALCQRGENLSSPRRASLPQETALGSLLDIVFTIPREESNYASNNTSSRINEPPLPTSGMPSLRRGSVPADISELRRDMFNRNSVNGKSRNRKKILYRRSSGGPEMFAGGMDGVDNGAWPKWKRDFVKRDSISEPLVKRRGSLPIDMLTISHVGIVAAPRKSSLWRL